MPGDWENVFIVTRVWAVAKISSGWGNILSRWGIKQLGISFGSNSLLFSYESSWGVHLHITWRNPWPLPLTTAMCVLCRSINQLLSCIIFLYLGQRILFIILGSSLGLIGSNWLKGSIRLYYYSFKIFLSFWLV